MKEFISTSGASVRINLAPFKDAMALKNALTKELSNSGIEIGNLEVKDVKNLDKSKIFNTLINGLLAIDSSEVIQNQLFKCLVRCTYNNEKITEFTFEKEEARCDFYEIAIECVKANLSPFFQGIISKLNINAESLLDTLKQ